MSRYFVSVVCMTIALLALGLEIARGFTPSAIDRTILEASRSERRSR